VEKRKNKMKIWVVTGDSESSDHYGPFVFSKKPSKELLKKIAFDCDGDDEEDGPGNYGSYVYLTVEKIEIDKEKI
jgi:hypothetical protein